MPSWPKLQGVPFQEPMGRQPRWQEMHGRMSSSRPSRSLVIYWLSARFCLPTPTKSSLPADMASAAASGCIRPEQMMGLLVKGLTSVASFRLVLSGI